MYYKVVSEVENKLLSAYVYGTCFSQEYKVGEFVFSPDNQPLMVFDCLKKAKTFYSCWGDAIYECEIVNPRKHFGGFISDLRERCSGWLSYSRDFFISRYKGIDDKDEIIPGTVFCDGVRLTKKVV